MTFPVPAKIETDASYVMDGPFLLTKNTTLTSSTPNATVTVNPLTMPAPARFGHSSTVSNLLLYIYGGQNRTNCHDGLWSFHLDTYQWKKLTVESTDGVVGSQLVAGFIEKIGSVLIILGGTTLLKKSLGIKNVIAGTADAGQDVRELNTTIHVATYRQVKLGQPEVAELTMDIGFKMQVDISGHYAALLPNSSMVLMYGGSFVSDQLPDGSLRDEANVLSNRLFTLNLANPGAVVITQRALGDLPSDRLLFFFTFAFATVAIISMFLFFLSLPNRIEPPHQDHHPRGSCSQSCFLPFPWENVRAALGFYFRGLFFPKYNGGSKTALTLGQLSSWSRVETTPHPTINEPGFALFFDGSNHYFIGHHCNSYDWRQLEFDETCGIGNRIYILDIIGFPFCQMCAWIANFFFLSAGKSWSTTQQVLRRPSEISTAEAWGGVLNLHSGSLPSLFTIFSF